MEKMTVVKDDVEIVKAHIDKREYRRVVLRNSLQVLLISDPVADKCAASMNVGVGSFSDPAGLEGLAHFLGISAFSSFDSILSRIGFDLYRILVAVLRENDVDLIESLTK
ncbi:unnamed protein product [Sphenostylis stenocarpa]|uniref:Peptidase M16 N-terminal domain-containing protein n=1 Tax=Sphenostylis stenocarpa TaxID=92480 RepID=A0AA86RYA7_9FABA|nr:unnamed protein product [Sphenostylis stenocarpa]